MPEIPPLSYIEAFEKGSYHQASMDETLEQAWKEDDDPMARAFLVLADAYLDAETGQGADARAKLARVAELARQGEGFKADSLAQHAEQCLEYLSMGKPLPELPSHF